MALIYTPSYKQPQKPVQPVAPAPVQIPQRKKGLLERVESIAKGVGIDPLVGAAKSLADTALGFGELGQKIFNPWSWAGNEEAKKSQEFAKSLRESKYVAPQSTGETVGFIGGKIAQALTPGAAGLTATRAASSLPLASTAVRSAAGFATEAAPQLLLASGQEGGVTKNALISGLLSGVGGVGGKLPNAAIGLGQVGYGAKQLAEGDISGGAMNIGFGALGLRGAAKTKGMLVNKQVVPPSQQKAIKQATETIDTILGAQPKEAKIAQRKALSGQTSKTPGQIATDHGVFGLDTDANGRLNTTAAREDIQSKVNSWDDLLENSLDDQYQRNSLTKERDSIIQTIRAGKVSGIKSASDRKAAIADIQQFFADEIEDAGELVTDRKLNTVKRGLNSAYKGGEPRLGYEAQRAARSHIQKTIEDQVKDVNVNGINKMMGELLDLDRALKAKQGMAVQGGRLTKKLNGIVGSVVGAPFGPFGSLAGAQLGEAVTDYAVDPYRRAMAAKAGLDLSGFIQPGQALRNETSQALADRTRANLTGEGKPKMLPAPSAIYAPAQSSTGPKMMSQRDAAESLRSTGTLPSEEEIRAAMSGSPLKRMELLQRVQSYSEPQAVPKAKADALPAKFERATGLSAEDAQIEAASFDHILKNEQSILEANKAKYGNVINTDNFRPAFKEQGYAGYNAASVQEPSSYLAKKARTEALKNPGADAITFAGGSGTGKTSAIRGIPELKDQQGSASVVMDGNLSSYSSALKWLKEARAAGKNTPIWYVYRDPMDAFENGIVKRMLTNEEEGGRLVPTKVTAGNHIGSWEVVQKLKKEGFDVIAIDNSLGANKARVIPFVEMQKKINYPSEQKLAELFNKKAKELLDKGTITREQYEGYIQ